MKYLFYCLTFLFIYSTALSQTKADTGYYYLNLGQIDKAVNYFEEHAKENPDDSRIRMQLGYIYYERKQYGKALNYFEYVSRNSKDSKDVEMSRSASYIIRDQVIGNSQNYFDLYFHNFYDTYQKNYIGNIIAHYNYKIAKKFYSGLYLDAYTDSRSRAGLIYNDRFVELGGFMRYNILDNLFLEFRLGYTRNLNQDSSSINVKPLVVYFTRFGDAKFFTNRATKKRTSLFMDIYYAAMYDLKYQNSFLQGSFQEVLRYGTGGYSFLESYLLQIGQFDSRQLSYNNYVELGAGLRFKPDVIHFPVFFVEPTYKIYLYGDVKNSFQVKAGFQFLYRTKL